LTQNSLNPQRTVSFLRVLRVLRCTSFLWFAAPLFGHDLEKTQVLIVFERDGSFVVDVANDPAWLTLRLASFPGPFTDRVVLWVDGREIRTASAEVLPGGNLTTHRLRGRMPPDARTLRWYYGLVADPYPLTIRCADGRVIVEEVQGDAWSGPIDLTGQFHGPLVSGRAATVLVAALFLVPLVIRLFTTKDTMDTKGKQNIP